MKLYLVSEHDSEEPPHLLDEKTFIKFVLDYVKDQLNFEENLDITWSMMDFMEHYYIFVIKNNVVNSKLKYMKREDFKKMFITDKNLLFLTDKFMKKTGLHKDIGPLIYKALGKEDGSRYMIKKQ